MGNVEFSKIGAAILRNKKLTSYIVRRLGNITPEEEDAGFIEIKFTKGDEEHVLKLAIGPHKKQSTLQPT
jgi:hypothetical protein